MDIDDYQITKYYTSAGNYYMMKQLFHNPYFPIFDFTLTNTKTNLSAKKKFFLKMKLVVVIFYWMELTPHQQMLVIILLMKKRLILVIRT